MYMPLNFAYSRIMHMDLVPASQTGRSPDNTAVMSTVRQSVPRRAWVVTFAGTAVNLCLGILYAWSVWKANLVGRPEQAGTPMTGVNEGWTYLSDAEGTWAYAICGFIFALCMIPGGRLQDRYGPKIGATLGGLSLAAG